MSDTQETINAGDVVQLKSGGPTMTADTLYSNGAWECKWFVETELRSGRFHKSALTKVISTKSSVPIPPQ